MTTIEDPVHQVQLNQAPEPDSDTEDDPGKLLNAWLGQLNQKVNIFPIFLVKLKSSIVKKRKPLHVHDFFQQKNFHIFSRQIVAIFSQKCKTVLF